MKKLLVLCIFCLQVFAVSSIEEREWAKNEFFLTFLENNNLPLSLYWNLDPQDRELASEIKEGERFQILWDNNTNTIEQILIPINGSDLQLHIYKNLQGEYTLTYSPISYETQTRILRLNVQNSAYQDVEQATGSTPLARAMRNAFGGSIDFKAMQKGDEVVLIYERKERMGERFGDILIKMASVEVNKKARKVYFYKDSFYDSNGKEMESFLLTSPVNAIRISSYFTRARYHPILKRYRAHLGVDYAAPTGTPVRSAGAGVVSFVGTKGGYGKTVQIQHSSGYSTLYAHLSRFAAIKKGQKISQGQTIAYVGSTGMSTGPHLHFGLYLNNQAINPLSIVKITKSELKGKDKQDFQNVILKYEKELQSFIDSNGTNPPKEPPRFERYVEF
ncbi:peptidoglycan DD-metalloendopeptidase family protein [Campylobacter sp. MIT 97-5078]|uniref:peptidoglycan DD-metalloendopeptidase family protein n=1 Tax=Campylobacter sp. MIT 97-5078 TaxID=1548153 RepID=UPI000513A63D|nr:peptidoglycan DD-metalloendopeptidase family protein [Campylobacter sp. MIT 97-5078]KGI57305.1 membrane protein [Campylobacter sp. MIT 97-5078]TQR28231.1 M23 family peptidase [Campylobacter sp. MIT 97-5078]